MASVSERWWEEDYWWGNVVADNEAEWDAGDEVPADDEDDAEGEGMGDLLVKLKPFSSLSWATSIPSPHAQPPIAPSTWGGFCYLQSLAEATTSRLWLKHKESNRLVGIDMVSLIHSCASKGILHPGGTKVKPNGLPLIGQIPQVGYRSRGTDQPQLTNFSVTSICAPNEVTTRSFIGTPAAMIFRESICESLTTGPVVASFRMQESFKYISERSFIYKSEKDGRDAGGHAILLYAYDCPGGDVKSLKIRYQDNAGARRDRGYIHPNCLNAIHVPCLDKATTTWTPGSTTLS